MMRTAHFSPLHSFSAAHASMVLYFYWETTNLYSLVQVTPVCWLCRRRIVNRNFLQILYRGEINFAFDLVTLDDLVLSTVPAGITDAGDAKNYYEWNPKKVNLLHLSDERRRIRCYAMPSRFPHLLEVSEVTTWLTQFLSVRKKSCLLSVGNKLVV